MLLAKEIVLVLAGKDFLPAASTLAILVWAPAILFVYIAVNSLVISQLTKFAVIITCSNVIVNLIGNLILLPRYGIQGAAIMTVVSETLQGIFYFYFVRKKITHYKFWAFVWRPAMAAGVMGLLIWLSKPALSVLADNLFSLETLKGTGLLLALLVFMGVAVYGVALLALGFFRADDINFVKQFLRKGDA
jgi:O-antigen/teichoic acid export membrane protein